MQTCSTIEQVALILFIGAMLAVIFIVYQINITLSLLKNVTLNFKSIAKNNIELGFYSLLAKIVGVKKKGGV